MCVWYLTLPRREHCSWNHGWGVKSPPHTKDDSIKHPKTNRVQAGREKRSNLIVCQSSTACSQQLQLPNDAASYDPIGNQSGLPSHAPQLGGLLYSPSSLTHSQHGARRLPFSLLGPLAGRKELKAPLSVWIQLHRPGPSTARVAGCQRDNG